MKSIIALVAVLALTTSASAATKTRSAKAAKKGTRIAAVKKPAVSDVSSAASDVQLTETAKLSEVKPIVQAKKWSLGLDADNYSQIQSANDGTADVSTDYAVKAGYKIADTMTATAVMEWSTTNGLGENEAAQTFEDPSLRLSKSDIADLGMGVGLSGQARLYLPVSEASQDAGQIAQIRVYGTASREVTKAISASFTMSPRFYIQQNDKYVNAEGADTNVNSFRLLSSAGLKYAVNDRLAFEQTLGAYQKWKTNTARADYLWAESSAYITVAKWFEIQTGIRQSDGATDLRKKGLSSLYNNEESEYFLTASFSI